MKPRYFFACGAMSVIAVATIGWSIWSAAALGQDAKPLANDEPFTIEPAGAPGIAASSTLEPATLRENVQQAPPSLAPGIVDQQPTATTRDSDFVPQVSPGVVSGPIGLPGPPHIPFGAVADSQTQHRQYVTRQTMFGFGAPGLAPTTTDARTLELSREYQTKQTEINELMKKLADSTSGKEKETLREEIVKATGEQFDLRQQVRDHEIEQLKKRLAEVEAVVKKRNELKDQIVEKRVADLLREPDQLGWEPVAANGMPSTQQTTSGYAFPAPASRVPLGAPSGLYVQTPATVPAPYERRKVTRLVQETIRAEDGSVRTIMRPVETTEYVPRENQQQTKSTNPSLDPNVQPTDRAVIDSNADRAVSEPFVPNGGSEQSLNRTIAEAAAYVALAEARYHQTKNKGGNVSGAELQARQAELNLARALHTKAQAEFERQTLLLELDLRKAKAEFDHAIAALEDATEASKRVSSATTKAEVTARRAAVQTAEIALERANIELRLHEKTKASQADEQRATKANDAAVPDALPPVAVPGKAGR